jgi:hypothetical protein
LCECNNETVNELEIKYIKQYDTLSPKGYNILLGNDHPVVYQLNLAQSRLGGFSSGHHPESKAKMSRSHTGKIVTDITKSRMSASRRGNLNHSFGKMSCNAIRTAKYSLEGHYIKEFVSMKKAAESLCTDLADTKQMDSLCSMISACTRLEIKTAKGYMWRTMNGEEGFPLRIDTLPAPILRERAVRAKNSMGLEMKFSSIKAAADYIGSYTSNICMCLSGQQSSTKGWSHWEYLSTKTAETYVVTKNGISTIYDSLRTAKLETGCHYAAIKRSLASNRPTKGYTWTKKVIETELC